MDSWCRVCRLAQKPKTLLTYRHLYVTRLVLPSNSDIKTVLYRERVGRKTPLPPRTRQGRVKTMARKQTNKLTTRWGYLCTCHGAIGSLGGYVEGSCRSHGEQLLVPATFLPYVDCRTSSMTVRDPHMRFSQNTNVEKETKSQQTTFT